MAYSNYHTHTTYCDGKNTPEEMICAAIAAGCPALGFSGHAHTAFDESYCMSGEKTSAYRRELEALRKKYAGQIRILIGVEQDFYSDAPTDGYDFVIGSVHYVKKSGAYIPVDESAEILLRAAAQYYDGDLLGLAEDYYRTVAQVRTVTRCDIVGHFDLITKFNEDGALLDENSPRYRHAALSALSTLLDQGAVLEINTGAISRGYRSAPYPAPFLLDEIARRGGKMLLSSDCHSRDAVCFGFPEAEKLAANRNIVLLSEI